MTPPSKAQAHPGGRWHYVWRHAQGHEFAATGTYREVEPPRRIVQVTSFNGEENTSTTTFTEENGRTIVTVEQRYASKASRDQALQYARFGTESSYARLDGYLASMR
ncbi:MAG TPA: SRPBCC domain-containing protein [Gemmatimonadales bacterium]|nr:SRPBCC domain-containing protein [Gemmatimonadales bacterium]